MFLIGFALAVSQLENSRDRSSDRAAHIQYYFEKFESFLSTTD